VQKRRSGRLSWWQDGQRIAACLASDDYHARRKTSQRCARGSRRPPQSNDSTAVPAFGTWAMARYVRSRSRSSPRTAYRNPIHNYCQYLSVTLCCLCVPLW
jgi:hypothetical protein